MTATILEGKIFSKQIRDKVKQDVSVFKERYQSDPGLAVIIVGENPASQVYVANKHKACEEVGIYSEVIRMPENITKEILLGKIAELN